MYSYDRSADNYTYIGNMTAADKIVTSTNTLLLRFNTNAVPSTTNAEGRFHLTYEAFSHGESSHFMKVITTKAKGLLGGTSAPPNPKDSWGL